MIVFDLKCICGCQFEGWFESRVDFDRQSSSGMIACPHCGSGKIRKILSPVAIHSDTAHTETAVPEIENNEITPETALNLLRSLQEYVEKNFEDVGSKLAQESLKIHYGVVAPRNIRGVATEHEEKMLLKEGIELLKIPLVKKLSDPDLN